MIPMYLLDVSDIEYGTLDKARKGAIAFLKKNKDWFDIDNEITIWESQTGMARRLRVGTVAYAYASMGATKRTALWMDARSRSFNHTINKDGSIRKR